VTAEQRRQRRSEPGHVKQCRDPKRSPKDSCDCRPNVHALGPSSRASGAPGQPRFCFPVFHVERLRALSPLRSRRSPRRLANPVQPAHSDDSVENALARTSIGAAAAACCCAPTEEPFSRRRCPGVGPTVSTSTTGSRARRVPAAAPHACCPHARLPLGSGTLPRSTPPRRRMSAGFRRQVQRAALRRMATLEHPEIAQLRRHVSRGTPDVPSHRPDVASSCPGLPRRTPTDSSPVGVPLVALRWIAPWLPFSGRHAWDVSAGERASPMPDRPCTQLRFRRRSSPPSSPGMHRWTSHPPSAGATHTVHPSRPVQGHP